MKQPRDAFVGSMFRRLFTPAVASALGTALSDMADAVVVGRRMGETGLAAIGISLPLYMVINICMHGFGTGGSVHYARLLSEGKTQEALRSFHRVLRASLCVSLLIAAAVNLFPEMSLRLMGVSPADGALYAATLDYVRIIALGAPLFFLSYILNDYLRSDEGASIASAGFLVGNLTDILLNIVFVIGLDMGTAGAAWATLLGLLVSIACYLPALLGRTCVLRLSFAPLSLHVREVFSLFRSGFSTSSQYLWQMLFLLVANHTLMAHLGGQGVAVFDMVQNASFLVMYLYDAAAKALQPLASTFWGEKNESAALQSRAIALRSGLLAGLCAIALISLFPGQVCAVFGLTQADTRAVAVSALRLYGLGASFAGLSVILESYYQATDQEVCAFVIALLRGCLVLIPVTLGLSLFRPDAFWWVFPLTESLSLLLFLLWKRRMYTPTRALDPARIYSHTIRSRADDIGHLTEGIAQFCSRHHAAPRQAYFVTMAAEEISLAIIESGFVGRADGVIQITLIALESGEFELRIRDNATTFNPFSLHTGKVGEGDFDADAMGMRVIKQRAAFFFYRRYQGFNTLIVRI